MDTSITSTSRKVAVVGNLRAIAAAVEHLPDDVPAPTHIMWGPSYGTPALEWLLFDDTDEATQKAEAARIVRAIGGKWGKRETGKLFRFEREDTDVHYKVVVDRPAVCERVVVGTEKRTIPAVEAQPERVEVVEQVEWRCQPLLADDPQATHDEDGSLMETYENDGVPA